MEYDALPLLQRQESGYLILEVQTDNLDFRSSESLKSIIHTAVENGSHQLVLDLTKVKFMDSSGLSVLLIAKRAVDEKSGSFAICGLHGYVNNLIRSTNLDKTINVFTTAAEAMA